MGRRGMDRRPDQSPPPERRFRGPGRPYDDDHGRPYDDDHGHRNRFRDANTPDAKSKTTSEIESRAKVLKDDKPVEYPYEAHRVLGEVIVNPALAGQAVYEEVLRLRRPGNDGAEKTEKDPTPSAPFKLGPNPFKATTTTPSRMHAKHPDRALAATAREALLMRLK